MRRINTCKDCPDRHPACHDHCVKYKEAYDRETKLLNKAIKERRPSMEHIRYMTDDKEKRRKKRR